MDNKCTSLRIRSNKGKVYYYCFKKREVINIKDCSCCVNKEYKKVTKPTIKKPLNKINKNNKVTKATSIPKKVKLKVWERDNHKCIFCHKPVS